MEINQIWNARVMAVVGAKLNGKIVSRIVDANEGYMDRFHGYPCFHIYTMIDDKEKLFKTIYSSDMEIEYK